jgi:multidrug efflux pump subunit AcrA (membrane-fusion protein)
MKWLKQNFLFIILLIITMIISGVIIWKIVYPAYKQPMNRTYTSDIGYIAMKRKFGITSKVKTVKARYMTINKKLLGEGYMGSDWVLVPVIPTEKITKVNIKEGEYVKKGDLLAKLNDDKIKIKINSARLALKTAQAELERVKLGSAYVLAQERPYKDRALLKATKSKLKLLQEEAKIYRKLVASNNLPRIKLIDIKKQIVEAKYILEDSQLNLNMSSKGRLQSKLIAQNAIKEAKNNIQHRILELKDYNVYAPANGIIERVLIHTGEYNQDTGKPAFVIASGLRFETHLDQTAIRLVNKNNEAEVFLEAFPEKKLIGKITHIIPIVSYNLGGPETNRPIRPQGTGTPEWPATFKVYIDVIPPIGYKLSPGLTGFAKILVKHNNLAIPRQAITSVSAGHGIVRLVKNNISEAIKVTYGVTNDGWTEITSGLKVDDEIMIEGQQDLRANDIFEISEQSLTK